MPAQSHNQTAKFERIFKDVNDLKSRIIKVEVVEDIESKRLEEISVKLDKLNAQLNQIVGKDAVRSAIYGVIGAAISGIVVWLISLLVRNN